MIRLRGVCRTYHTEAEKIVALNNVSLDVAAGELLAISGASGSGKTTLINVIAGLLSVDQGSVQVAGQDIASMSSNGRADVRLSEIGVVFQDHNLIPEFTALENATLPLRASGLSRNAAASEVEDLLSRMGLSGSGARFPRQLSGGQQQRIGIARALAGGKRILLADEPTGSLDVTNSAAIFELLRELADSGVCVLVASHDPQVLQVATRTAIMADGVLAETEPSVA